MNLKRYTSHWNECWRSRHSSKYDLCWTGRIRFIGIVLRGGNISELWPSDTVTVTNQLVDIGTAEEEEDEPEPQGESEEAEAGEG
jgi:hypothetical protein